MNRRPRTIVTVDDELLAARCAKGRVIIIDDDVEVLSALRALIEFEGFAAETYSGAQDYLAELALGAAQFPGPVCRLCDVNMPMLSGLEMQSKLMEVDDVPLLLMSGVSGAYEAASAFRAGALDFLIKPISADTLFAAIENALSVSTKRQQNSQQMSQLSCRANTLSERERSVVKLVAKGMTNQAIAETLHIALRTVKLHRQRGMEKLDAATTADLVRIVDRLNLQ